MDFQGVHNQISKEDMGKDRKTKRFSFKIVACTSTLRSKCSPEL